MLFEKLIQLSKEVHDKKNCKKAFCHCLTPEHCSIQFFCIGDTRYRYRLRYSILGTRYSILLPNRYSILDTDTRYFSIRAETCTFSALVPLSPYKKFHFISIAHKQCHNISCQLLQCIACKKVSGPKVSTY